MKILVTGGSGYIGSRLVEKLLAQKHDVAVFDSADKKQPGKKAKFIKGDIRDEDEVRRAVKNCEAVFHLAALVDARSTDEDALYAINVLGAKNVFDAAVANNAKVIFTSSAAVYGNTDLPHKESTPCKPPSGYGKGKLQAEKYLEKKTEKFFAARLFNVYGPGSKSAVNTFCKKITNFQDVTVFGSGLQTRDYVYVADAVDALLLGLANSGTYNVGTGQDISTSSLIEMIHNATRCKPSIKYEPPIKGEVLRSRADITKIKQLGWAPKIVLEEGIKEILDSVGFKKFF